MVWIERKIMSLTASPFLCNLLYAFESERELFLVMPFMQGGDLRFHLKERGTMPVSTACFYAAEMILGLQAMHEKRVVFRDLKPDNMYATHLTKASKPHVVNAMGADTPFLPLCDTQAS
jgi:serine/threonine protein kinase